MEMRKTTLALLKRDEKDVKRAGDASRHLGTPPCATVLSCPPWVDGQKSTPPAGRLRSVASVGSGNTGASRKPTHGRFLRNGARVPADRRVDSGERCTARCLRGEQTSKIGSSSPEETVAPGYRRAAMACSSTSLPGRTMDSGRVVRGSSVTLSTSMNVGAFGLT